MNLDEAQKKQVSAWIAEGHKLADIQKRLGAELGVTAEAARRLVNRSVAGLRDDAIRVLAA